MQEDVQSLEKLLSAPVLTRLDLEQVKALIPHRPPFLLVDSVDIIEEGRYCLGHRVVDPADPVFGGHFPGYPIYPAVLLVEALSQAGGVLLMRMPLFREKIGFTMSVEGARFRQPVRPGQHMKMAVEILRAGSRAGRMRGEIYVDGVLHAETTAAFIIADKSKVFGKEA